MPRISLVILAFIIASCYVSDEVAIDQETWEYAQPDTQGLSGQNLINVNELIKGNQFQEITGLIIIKNNKLVFENYYTREVDPLGMVTRAPTLTKRELNSNIGSAGLVFALSAIAVAVDKRLLSIEDPISDYLPEYADVFVDSPEKAEITIANILEHRGGLVWSESFDPESDINQMKLSNDWIRYILERPVDAAAGFRYRFNTGAGLILAKIVENASGESFDTFLANNVLEPLTITSFDIGVDPQGNFNCGDGISISLLDWTKLAYMYLNDGMWQGRTVIDPNFVTEATSSQAVISSRLSQGQIWQLYGDDFAQFFGVAHDDIYFVRGAIGQQIFVIPSENMIVSIFAENFFFGFFNPTLYLFAEITNSFR